MSFYNSLRSMVPPEWIVSRHSRYFVSRMGETILKSDLVNNGKIPVFSATESDKVFGYVNNASALLKPRDIVIPARGISIGAAMLVVKMSTSTQTTIQTRPISTKIHSPYLLYFFKAFRNELFAFDNTAIPQITVEQVSSNPILIPPKETQKEIADFLDRETARIDQMIEVKERLIKLLNEKRISLITEAVTQGLDSKAKLKDSGIPWLGKIPQHWELKKLKHCSRIISSNVDKKTIEGEIIVRLCNYIDVYYNDIITNDLDFMITTATQAEIERFALRLGDVVLTKDSESANDIGIPALVGKGVKELVCGYHLAILRGKLNQVYPSFLFYVIKSALSAYQFEISAKGITRFGLSYAGLGELSIIAPPLLEQKEIADFLDKKTAEIDQLKNKVNLAIDKLKEYRISLITEAVTGKISVKAQSYKVKNKARQ